MLKTFARALALSTLLATAVAVVPAPSAEAATAKELGAAVKKAKRTIAKQVRAMARSKRKVRALEKRLKADRRKLAKAAAGARAKLRARIAKTRTGLRKARAALRGDTRTHNRAARLVNRGDRLIARAKVSDRRRKARQDRREKLQQQRAKAKAQRQASARNRTTQPAARRSFALTGESGWLGLQVFGLRAGGARTSAYGRQVDNGVALPAIPVKTMPKRLLRQRVRYVTSEKAGTVVVDTKNRYLYFVMGNGRAMRYGIGVGRAGMAWSGTATVGWKRKWPTWTPPAEMIARQPKYAKYSAANGGMPGGLGNPLGARALYLMQGGRDTLYRLHGTPNWRSIGTAQSSGCIRLMNQDVIDLYERVQNGAKVIVR